MNVVAGAARKEKEAFPGDRRMSILQSGPAEDVGLPGVKIAQLRIIFLAFVVNKHCCVIKIVSGTASSTILWQPFSEREGCLRG